MQLDILTPEQKIYSGEAKGIKLPGINGAFEILNDHAPIISALDEGQIRINGNEGVQEITIKSGFVEGLNNKITVLVEGAEL